MSAPCDPGRIPPAAERWRRAVREPGAGPYREISARFWDSVLVDVRRTLAAVPGTGSWRVGVRETGAWREMAISTHRWSVAIHSAEYQRAQAMAAGWRVTFHVDTRPVQHLSLQVPGDALTVLPLRLQLFARDQPGRAPLRSIGLLWHGRHDTRRLVTIAAELGDGRRVTGDYDLQPAAASWPEGVGEDGSEGRRR
jgi:hypothetical protein